VVLNGEPLVIRVDGGAGIGLGHVTRCVALATAWRERGGPVVAVTTDAGGPAGEQLRLGGIEVVTMPAPRGSILDASRLCAIASDVGTRWAVVDGYEFDADYLEVVKSSGLGLIYLDDLGQVDHYCSDIVINGGVNALHRSYVECADYTTLLLGPQYALLRSQFLNRGRRMQPASSTAHKLLITLGGGSSGEAARQVIRALDYVDQEDIETVVVLGAANDSSAAVKQAARDCKRHVELKFRVEDMCAWMHWADLAIAGAGSTCYELACVGLPAVVMVLANNQEPSGRGLSDLGVVWNLGRIEERSEREIGEAVTALMRDETARQRMHEAGVALVDAHGARRAVLRIQTSDVTLRPARAEDCAMLWNWANDETTRRSSFTSDPIPWEMHVRWYQNKLRDPASFLLVAEREGGGPLGQVRFDRDTVSDTTISIGIDSAVRGRGYGASLLLSAVEEVFRTWPVGRVNALIRRDNEASAKSFLMAGFRRIGTRTVKGILAECYSRERGPWDPPARDAAPIVAPATARKTMRPCRNATP
jgi:UDP-2,4-diacetamido-2,4,6-trideoxy-beta-L-altropyranose hydrolase